MNFAGGAVPRLRFEVETLLRVAIRAIEAFSSRPGDGGRVVIW